VEREIRLSKKIKKIKQSHTQQKIKIISGEKRRKNNEAY
jgi:hypothetical protein